MKTKLTDAQKNILELMKAHPLQKYNNICYVGDKKFNANSVKPLIKKGIICFYVHDNLNEWDYFQIAEEFQTKK